MNERESGNMRFSHHKPLQLRTTRHRADYQCSAWCLCLHLSICDVWVWCKCALSLPVLSMTTILVRLPCDIYRCSARRSSDCIQSRCALSLPVLSMTTILVRSPCGT
jgi:hypothetical protein